MPYIAPYRSQLRPYNHAYAYRGLTAFATLSMAVSEGARMPRPYGSAAMLGKTGRPETRCAQTVRPADRFFLCFSLVSKRDTKRCVDQICHFNRRVRPAAPLQVIRQNSFSC
ncbi:MAG: hypothetical protein ABW170_18260 [Candidatus Thiodiazotropha sp. L084R]